MTYSTPKAYLDTSIISGVAKSDMDKKELVAWGDVKKMYLQGEIELFTSEVAKKELEEIKEEYRIPHDENYKTLLQVPIAPIKSTTRLSVMGIPMAGKENPLNHFLKNVLPDPPDVEHIFTAYKNRMHYFVTVDCKTILKHRLKIEERCGLKLVKLTELQKVLNQR